MLSVRNGIAHEEETEQPDFGESCAINFLSQQLLDAFEFYQGRLYDGHVLDMFEFGVNNFISIENFHGSKKGIGSKPILLFSGDIWQRDSLYSSIQNLIIDMFRGDTVDKISPQGLDHVLSCSCIDGTIYIRGFMCNFRKQDGTKVRLLMIYINDGEYVLVCLYVCMYCMLLYSF